MKQIHLDILSKLSAEDPETAKYFNSSLCIEQRKPNGYWNIQENCLEDALKYNTRTEWQKQSSGAYHRACIKGWLPICTKHMNGKQKKPNGYWEILENCQEDALKYKTRAEWKKQSGSAYNASKRNGWLPVCTKHMKTKERKPRGYWEILENCQEDALLYKTRYEWHKQNQSSYSAACRKGWVPQCTKHMEQLRKPSGYWNILENCQEDALRYKTRSEWEKQSSGAYNASKRNGWLDICCKHMIKG